MTSSWNDNGRRQLRKKIIESRKQHYLDRIMQGDLSPSQTEDVVKKVAKCNEILFQLAMSDNLS